MQNAKFDDGFKTLHKNMLALRHLGEIIILIYVKRLNPFCNIFANPPVLNGTTAKRFHVTIWMQTVQLFMHKKKQHFATLWHCQAPNQNKICAAFVI